MDGRVVILGVSLFHKGAALGGFAPGAEFSWMFLNVLLRRLFSISIVETSFLIKTAFHTLCIKLYYSTESGKKFIFESFDFITLRTRD